MSQTLSEQNPPICKQKDSIGILMHDSNCNRDRCAIIHACIIKMNLNEEEGGEYKTATKQTRKYRAVAAAAARSRMHPVHTRSIVMQST